MASEEDEDDYRFGDIPNGDDQPPEGGPNLPNDPSGFALEIFRTLFVVLVMGYIVLYVAHVLFGTPDPTGFL